MKRPKVSQNKPFTLNPGNLMNRILRDQEIQYVPGRLLHNPGELVYSRCFGLSQGHAIYWLNSVVSAGSKPLVKLFSIRKLVSAYSLYLSTIVHIAG